MSSELLTALFRRRSSVDAGAETWESKPERSGADVAHLAGLDLTAPDAGQWLRGLERAPEEDLLKEVVAEELEARGDAGPAHAPRPDIDAAELEEALARLRKELEAERAAQGKERESLADWEAKLRSRERALEEEQRKSAEAAKDYPKPEWLKNIKGTLNIGVVGNAGVGKSLLINRLRRLRPHAVGWAEVGVRETTKEPQMHSFPDEPRVRLWDIPGAGTTAVPAETYIRDMGLRYFDKVLIVSAGRFMSMEVALRDELDKHGVPYFMVRTKVDIDVWNNREDNGLDEKTTLAQIAKDMKDNHGVPKPYLVSSRDVEAYDMQRLCNDLFPGLKRKLDPTAPCFYPSAEGWGDAWLLTPEFSPTLAGLQGRWRDANGYVYLVQGAAAHITLPGGQATVMPLQQRGGEVWWGTQWYVVENGVKAARHTGQVHWIPANKTDYPLVWWWYD